MKVKAIRKKEGFQGVIPDLGTYERVKRGETDWPPHVKEQMTTVTIPFSLFSRLILIDSMLDRFASAANKEEESEEGDNDAD